MALTYNVEVTFSMPVEEPLDMLELARSLSGFHSSAVPVVCAIGSRVRHGAIVELTATRAQVLAWWAGWCGSCDIHASVRVMLAGVRVYDGCIQEWTEETTTPIESDELSVTVPTTSLTAEQVARSYAQQGIDAVVCRKGNHIESTFLGYYGTPEEKRQYVRDLIDLL